MLSRVLPYFKNVKGRGQQFTALCPAHGDKVNSLSLRQSVDRVLIHCFAGCQPEEITGAVGLTMKDLFSDDRLPHFRPIKPKDQDIPLLDEEVINGLVKRMTDQAYSWLEKHRAISKDASIKYQIGLWEKDNQKRFAIPIRDQEGKAVNIRLWLPPLGLYKDPDKRKEAVKIKSWPDVIEGRGKARIWPLNQLISPSLILCEGEMDALALISHRFSAITATGGAGTWRDEWSQLFKGKTVSIAYDNDKAGSEGAIKVSKALSETGVKIKIIKWPKDRPDGWDITDEFLKGAGHE